MDDTYYLDWSLRNGVTGVKNDEEKAKRWPKGTNEFLDSIKDSPSTLIMESTVHSFVKDDRKSFIKRCADEGHDLMFTPPRETGRWSRELRIEKSDDNDPGVLREMVGWKGHAKHPRKYGCHLKRPSVTESAYITKSADANYQLMLLRAKGQKEEWATSLIAQLPEYKTLDATKKAALGNGKEYSKVAVAAAAMATAYADSRREFERLCGLYAHGYPSQIRADLYHWTWSGGGKRARLNGEPIETDSKGSKKWGIRKRDDITLSEFRRSVRWLYSELKPLVGTEEPETGTD